MNPVAVLRPATAMRQAMNAGRTRNAILLAAIGGAALLLGLIVYLADRGAGTAILLPAGLWSRGGGLLTPVGFCLPSFVHPFAFALFTVALRPVAGASAYRVCAAWWAVNVAFELGQRPDAAEAIAAALRASFGQAWPARLLANYFLHGTFDRADLLAASAGALAAALVIHLVAYRTAGIDHEQ